MYLLEQMLVAQEMRDHYDWNEQMTLEKGVEKEESLSISILCGDIVHGRLRLMEEEAALF